MLVVLAPLSSLDESHFNCVKAQVLGMLSAAQRDALLRYRREEDLALRTLVRALLVFGVRELAGWNALRTLHCLCTEPLGRPYVQGLGRSVSFSHAGDVAVCCIGESDSTVECVQAGVEAGIGAGVGASIQAGVGVGVDIERIVPLPPRELASVFSDAELADILSAPDPTDALFARWTAKEAILKARGTGFLQAGESVCTATSPFEGVYWQRLDAPPGYVLTAAGPVPVQARQVRPASASVCGSVQGC